MRSRLVALEHKRPQVCACGIDSRCIARRPAADDDYVFYSLPSLYGTCTNMLSVSPIENGNGGRWKINKARQAQEPVNIL